MEAAFIISRARSSEARMRVGGDLSSEYRKVADVDFVFRMKDL